MSYLSDTHYDYRPYLTTAIQAARAAGDYLLNAYFDRRSPNLHELGGHKPFSLDHETEQQIVDFISKKYPDHNFLCEEQGSLVKNLASEYQWIIDPLDGTNNFIQNIPFFAVSIALTFRNDLVVGVVFDPIHNDLFTAIKGQGALLNNKRRMRIRTTQSLAQSIISTNLNLQNCLTPKLANSYQELLRRSPKIRYLGATALEMAYLANGSFDVHIGLGIFPWDIAAGYLLIQEAGGFATKFDEFSASSAKKPCISANPTLFSELSDIFDH